MLPDRSFSELFDDDLPADPVTGTRARTLPAERRAVTRLAFEADVTVASSGQFFSGVAADLSTEGIFIATHRAVSVGTHLTLEFALPEGQVLARGVVRWIRPVQDGVTPGVGVAFEDLSVVDRELIEQHCAGRPRYFTYEEIKSAIGTN